MSDPVYWVGSNDERKAGDLLRSTLGILCILIAPIAVADDWNTGAGGDSSRDCFSTEIGPTDPEILWDGSLPAIVAQQAAIEGDVVVMARITSFTIPTGTTIIAHDLSTGATLWDTQLPFDFPDSWRSRVSAIRDGRVYARCLYKYLHTTG